LDESLQYNPEPFFLTTEDIHSNKLIVENLKLLGWEENELISLLLSSEMNLAKIFYQLLYEHRKNSHKTHLNNTMRTNSHHHFIRRSSSTSGQYNYPEFTQTDIYRDSPYLETNSEPMDTDSLVLPKDNATNRTHLTPVLEPTPEYSPRSILTPKKEGKTPQPKKLKLRKIIRDGPNPNSTQSVEPVVGNMNENRLRVPFRVPRQRAATEGDSIRPEIGVSEGRYFVGWNVSPSKDPNSRSYKFESNRSITQILENLKDCFGKFEMELTSDASAVSPGEPIKLKGQGKNQEGEVEVELIPTSNGNTVASFTRSSNLYQEYFCNLIKELELGSTPQFCVL
jgi:hypothetical protein